MTKNLFLLTPLVLLACQDVPSKSIYTQAMEAEFDVTIEGDIALVQASLVLADESPRTYVELTGADALQAIVGETTYDLQHDEQMTRHSYSQSIPLNGLTDVQISFIREYGEDAVDSLISVPSSFSVLSPTEYQLVPVGETLDIRWADMDSEGMIDISVTGDCFVDYDVSEDIVSGHHRIATSNLGFFEGDNGACAAELLVEYASEGQIDSTFSGGFFTARRIQKVPLVFVPSVSIPDSETGSESPAPQEGGG